MHLNVYLIIIHLMKNWKKNVENYIYNDEGCKFKLHKVIKDEVDKLIKGEIKFINLYINNECYLLIKIN